MNETNTIETSVSSSENTAKIIYILYLAGLFIGLTAIIGVIMAYINKNDAPAWLQTHYRKQIQIFWLGFLFIIIGAVTSLILIGYLIILAWIVWLIIRCVKGLKALDQKLAV
jgi:uncharacterized membrane protein